VRVVEQGVNRLVAVEINDAEVLPLVDLVDPRFACGNHVPVDRLSGIEFALDHDAGGRHAHGSVLRGNTARLE